MMKSAGFSRCLVLFRYFLWLIRSRYMLKKMVRIAKKPVSTQATSLCKDDSMILDECGGLNVHIGKRKRSL